MLAITPNCPQVEGRQLVRLWQEGTSWQAEVDCRIRLTSAPAAGELVDEIRVDAPHPFNGPYQLTAEPPATLR